MESSNYCDNCKVNISEDLKYCPLCGKFVLKNENEKAKETVTSFPKYDFLYIYKQKWLKLVNQILFLVGLISVAINFVFLTTPMWFPYSVASLLLIYFTIFYPFKDDRSHITSLPLMGLSVALFLIFLDVYNFFCIGTTFGWACFVAGPCVLTATAVTSCILSLCLYKNDGSLMKGILMLLIVSIIFFIIKVCAFIDYIGWPIWMYLLFSIISLVTPLLFKRRKLSRELNKNFHI